MHSVKELMSSCKREESKWLEIDFTSLSANRRVVQKEVTTEINIIDVDEKKYWPLIYFTYCA